MISSNLVMAIVLYDGCNGITRPCFSSSISPYRSSSTLKISAASGRGVFPAVKANTLFFTSIQLCPGFFLKPAPFIITLTLFESSHIPQVAYKLVISM